MNSDSPAVPGDPAPPASDASSLHPAPASAEAAPPTPAPLSPPMPAEVPPRLAPGASPADAPEPQHPFTFHGTAAEYFRIWVVNTLLTLLTCGIYSAWAKVRKRRYLRGCTELMGHRFDYRANPRRILVGNVLVAVIFLAYMLFGQVYPVVRIAAILVGLCLLPWVIVRSLAFNAHNTVYRGMRFYFHQTYGMTALVFIGQWLVILVTFGIYFPAWERNQKEFVIANHRLGDAFFPFESKSGPFYTTYFVAGAATFGLMFIAAMFTGAVMAVTGSKVPSITMLLPTFAIYGLAVFLSKHLVFARLFNHIWNGTRLDDHRFVATLRVDRWLKLQFTNLAAIIGTCGLLYPWAVVRSTQYLLSCLEFKPARPIERIAALGRNPGSAVGDTAAEFVGMDFGL